MGAGAACEIDVEGIGLLRAGSANIIVIVAIAAAGVVAVLAVIVVVILICKKRRPKDQCESKNKSPLTNPLQLSRICARHQAPISH